MNKVYEVLDIKDGCYAIKDGDETKFYPRLKFRRNIAQTAHAVQGETIAENFGIFEFGSNPDWRWLYVALSRASSLKQAWFYDGEPLLKRKELGVVIREKLASYKEQDEAAGRSHREVHHGEVGDGALQDAELLLRRAGVYAPAAAGVGRGGRGGARAAVFC
jgi:hypothetical protein